MKRLVFMIAILAALGLAPMAPMAAGLTLTDMAGRRVVVPAAPQRVLALGPGCLRLLVYLGATDRVVGVEQFERRMGGRPYYLAHRERIDALPVVSPGGPAAINKKPDLEKVLAVKPQLIFATMLDRALADQVQALLKTPVVILDYGVVGGFSPKIFQSLEVAGRALGLEKRAAALVDFVKKEQADLSRRARGLAAKGPAVYVGGVSFKGFHGLDSTNTRYLPFQWLGAKTAFQSKSKRAYLFLDREALLRLQPGVIFLDAAGLDIVKGDLAKRPDYYRALKAFATGRVYLLHPYNWYSTNLGAALADSFAIGRALYPRGFKDIDPAAEADRIYTFLVGKAVNRAMAAMYGPLGARFKPAK